MQFEIAFDEPLYEISEGNLHTIFPHLVLQLKQFLFILIKIPILPLQRPKAYLKFDTLLGGDQLLRELIRLVQYLEVDGNKEMHPVFFDNVAKHQVA